MAEMTIRLQIDPATNKKDIVVTLRSDEDALPFEHEQQHRQLVDKLVEGGVVSAEEVGKVVVHRDELKGVTEADETPMQQDQRQSHAQGQ